MFKMNVLIAETSPLFSLGLSDNLKHIGYDLEIESAKNFVELITKSFSGEYELLIVNAGLLKKEYVPVLKVIAEMGHCRVLLMFDSFTFGFKKIAEQLKPNGCIEKKANPIEFRKAVTRLLNGKQYFDNYHKDDNRDLSIDDRLDCLTKRENEVLLHVVEGGSNKEIAYHLRVSESTVKKHVSNVLKKLGVENRVSVVGAIKGTC